MYIPLVAYAANFRTRLFDIIMIMWNEFGSVYKTRKESIRTKSLNNLQYRITFLTIRPSIVSFLFRLKSLKKSIVLLFNYTPISGKNDCN